LKAQTAQSLLDCLDAVGDLGVFLGNASLAEYESNRGQQLQVERLLEIIGEALNRAAKSERRVLDLIPDAHSVIGMRNWISHGYDAIDNETVWTAATYDVPLLGKQIEALLEDNRT
jgi:uncharacterized protein with HEPN domain